MSPLKKLTLDALKESVALFIQEISKRGIRNLYGVTDGKAVGTHIEHMFHRSLQRRFAYQVGSSASGIDFPTVDVDLKTTSIQQPQSSCPFKSASQKVYGLGYHLIVLVYSKRDDRKEKTARLRFPHAVFVNKQRTADYQTTKGLLEILQRGGNKDDVAAFLEERNLPLDEVGRRQLADQILKEPPLQGYLTVSNALQWRLQYGRVITLAAEGGTDGLITLLPSKNLK